MLDELVKKLNETNKVKTMTFELGEKENIVVRVKKYKRGDNFSTSAQIDYLRDLDNVTWRSNNCINHTNKWQLSNMINIAKENKEIDFYIDN